MQLLTLLTAYLGELPLISFSIVLCLEEMNKLLIFPEIIVPLSLICSLMYLYSSSVLAQS